MPVYVPPRLRRRPVCEVMRTDFVALEAEAGDPAAVVTPVRALGALRRLAERRGQTA
eukprot:gene8600-7433_t